MSIDQEETGMAQNNNFVGRENELREFRRIIPKSDESVRVLFILGSGGIGKTQLAKRMLEEARSFNMLAPEEPLDLFSTDLRHIDGIQLKIIETIENLTGLKNETSPFAEFFGENANTSEQFNKCLKIFCEKNPLVLTFDTFENLDIVASNWLFESGDEGLQVPGLICVVASRPEKDYLEKYRSNPLVKAILISGLTLQEAEEFYQRISNEFDQVDLLTDFLAAAGIGQDNESIEWIWKITEGHPLRLEMAFRWAGTLLREKSLIDISAEKFEQKLMERVRGFGETGLLDVGPLRVSQPVFDTLVCMGYITRRFDERFLRFLIDEKLIRLDEPDVSEKDILDNLEKYFFVKRRSEGEGRYVLQLHDEMARLVREYVWPFLDPSGEKKKTLLRLIIQFYDQLIGEVSNET
jgi:hypothetical protein